MELEQYGHGGDLRSAKETYGRNEDAFIDFSSNMNPLGPPDVIQHKLAEYVNHIFRYPDPISRELRKSLALAYGVPEECILVGNGAAECIDLAARVWKPRLAGLARPCFSEYEEAISKAGGAEYTIPLKEENQFRLQITDLQAALDQCDTICLGHPNNPTGTLLAKPCLDLLKESGCRVILDEAFLDFIEEDSELSLIQHAAQSLSCIVIRSMTKFYSVPGIRIGFAVAHPDTIEAMRALQIPWSVNSLAQQLGPALLSDSEFTVRTRQWLQQEKEWFTAQLSQLGLKVYPSATNFLLFALPQGTSYTVGRLQHELGLNGILIRDGSRFPGLDNTFGRLAIRLRKDNELLLKAVYRCLHGPQC
ncbi:threonine-phosphate decarboxylase CobD [Paenibacillus senegalensis]|uniref:threonine-phosphate decarboxylase CobD n=1 Tax=Paenibacillus senegalensis TaxID=1465766 RepID=UPI0002895E20|nr:threonine-phosphate decarboxylase CobD [Paenibacillus senegalensis]